MAKATSETPETEVQESMIYYGPNLPKGLLAQFTVFNAGLPAHIFDSCPEAKKAFAPISKFAEVLKNLNDPHSIESANVESVRSSFMKGN